LALFLFFRAIEGFAGGAFLTRTFVFTAVQFDLPQRPPALVSWAISYFTIGRVLSPIVNGWFADNLTWRALFAVSALLSTLAAILFFKFTLRSWHSHPEEHFRLDVPGVFALAMAVVCFQIVLSRGEVDAWFESSTIVLLLVLGIAAHAIFAVWELHPRNQYPLFDLSMIRTRAAFSAAVVGYPIGILLAGSVYVLPQYLRAIETHSASQTGLILSIGFVSAVGILAFFRLTIQAIQRFGGITILAFALLLECGAQFWFAHYITVDTPDRYLWIPLLCNGAFVALSVPTLGLVAFSKVENRDISTARTIYYGARQFGASLGVTCAVVLIDRRLSFHTSRLLDAYVNRNLGIVGASDPVQIPEVIHAAIRRQASVLAYTDVFHVMAFIALTTLIFLPLLPVRAKSVPTSSTAPSVPFASGERTA
jgi:MFS transporter, DHA2 family, multidrug resistance protein